MIDLVIIGILTFIILVLLIDRFLTADQHQGKESRLLEENSRLIKAIISKNANEYVMTASIDKVAPEEKPPTSPDMIPEEALNDEEFFDAIGKGLKEDKK